MIFVENDFKLCYIDGEDFIEFNPSCSLSVDPFSRKIRRFYLVANYDITEEVLEILVSLNGAQKKNYAVKVLAGNFYSTEDDFKNASHCFFKNISLLDKKDSNIIPIDIMLESFSITSSVQRLDITLKLGSLEKVDVEIDCTNGTPTTSYIDIPDSGLYDIYIENNDTPLLSNVTIQEILSLQHEKVSITKEELTGFRIRTRWTMTKSDQLHTYTPTSVGTNGEKVINLANLFNDETFKDANGWSMWSRELTFDDINFVNSNGGVTIVFNSQKLPNYWYDFSAITTLAQFFDLLSEAVEYVDNT